MKTLILITGGIRSGKSSFALDLARERCAGEKCFIATAEALDEEMRVRIKRHQEERGTDFYTVEEPLDLAGAVARAQEKFPLILIDCLTLWVNNLLFYQKASDTFLKTIEARQSDMIIVTNEIGLGVIPENPLARRFIDELGFLNRYVAQQSDEVYFMVSGIPQCIKGETLGKLER